MTDIIDSVARMTGNRDRDVLEATVVAVLSDVVRPTCARFYKLVPVGDVPRVHLAAEAEAGGRVRTMAMPARGNLLPPMEAFPHGSACVASGEPATLEDDLSGTIVYVVPITNGSQRVGWVELDCEAPLTQPQHRVLDGVLRIYGNHLSILEYSERDQLTGLMNRKTFDDAFMKVLAALHAGQAGGGKGFDDRRRAASGTGFWLGVVDIDHFKRINDRFGHLYGDEVLVLMARMMRASFRLADKLYRFGGEEFAILLDRTPEHDVGGVWDRFRERVEQHEFPQIGQVTVSVGFTQIEPGDSPAAAFDRADEALYYAKQHGRNRVCSYEGLRASGELAAKEMNGEVELF